MDEFYKQEQMDEISQALDDIIATEIGVFAHIIKDDFIMEYAHLRNYPDNKAIDVCIEHYKDKLQELYDLR